MIQEFWVVGGRYRDASFADLQEGSGELFGPFLSYGEALASWRERTATTRAQATVRYTVVVTAGKQAAA
jgi:Domain of unknown function (DUF4170)